jgi:hypothetical protein
VHGGDSAPLGYKFSERADGTTNVRGAAKHGPLVPSEPEASRVREAFGRFGAEENWASWSEVIALLGLKSIRNARAVLTNRVYTGTAYSGEFEKAGAHEPLVDEATFDRVQRRLGDQAEDYASRTRAPREALALAKVLRCKSCGNVLTPDRTKRGGKEYVNWRCHRASLGVCKGGSGSIANTLLEGYVIEQAVQWHALSHPSWALGKAVDDATLPALEAALMEAQAEVLRLEREIGTELPATSTQKIAVEKAKAAIRDHEASQGWIARPPEAVAAMIESGDVETLNEFLRQTVRVVVRATGKHAKAIDRAPSARTKLLFLDHGRTAGGENPETFIPLPTAVQS